MSSSQMGWMDRKHYNPFDLLKGYKFIKIPYKLEVRKRDVLNMKKKPFCIKPPTMIWKISTCLYLIVS